MSYDISLVDPVTKNTLEVDDLHFIQGGTYQLGGTKELWLNVTWNYGDWYRHEGVFPVIERKNEDGEKYIDKGIRSIYGMTGLESIPVLEHAIEVLKTLDDGLYMSEEDKEIYAKQDIFPDSYWYGSRENAMRPLYQLLAFAKMRPDGIWEGD